MVLVAGLGAGGRVGLGLELTVRAVGVEGDRAAAGGAPGEPVLGIVAGADRAQGGGEAGAVAVGVVAALGGRSANM